MNSEKSTYSVSMYEPGHAYVGGEPGEPAVSVKLSVSFVIAVAVNYHSWVLKNTNLLYPFQKEATE